MKLARLVHFIAFVVASFAVAAAAEPMRREWNVDGATREGLVAVPAKATTDPTPVVFVFHGHGGSMQNAARSFHLHTLWPEALVVYLQGLNTPGRLTDPEGKKPGWQHSPGAEGDRDLQLFDAVLASLRKEFRVDDHRIYSTGHSNGGGFTYLLWATRGDVFAAVAPSAAAAPLLLRQLKPKPVLHLAGEKDPLVKFEWQQQTIDAVRKINQCEDGRPGEKGITTYPSKIGAPVLTFIHPGGHQFVPEEPAIIAKFFKEHVKP
jgi:polyhydroxybutyrate depolymerase